MMIKNYIYHIEHVENQIFWFDSLFPLFLFFSCGNDDLIQNTGNIYIENV